VVIFRSQKGSAGKEVGETGLDNFLSVWKTILIVTTSTINIIKFNIKIRPFVKNNCRFSTIINKIRHPALRYKDVWRNGDLATHIPFLGNSCNSVISLKWRPLWCRIQLTGLRWTWSWVGSTVGLDTVAKIIFLFLLDIESWLPTQYTSQWVTSPCSSLWLAKCKMFRSDSLLLKSLYNKKQGSMQ
jgi:hypothetical protein